MTMTVKVQYIESESGRGQRVDEDAEFKSDAKNKLDVDWPHE